MVNNSSFIRQVKASTDRYNNRNENRDKNELLIKEKKFFNIDTPERVEKFLKRRGVSQFDISSILRTSEAGIPDTIQPIPDHPEPNFLERIIGESDLMSISFLEKGLITAASIGRIWLCSQPGKVLGYGTGFMVSPKLLITNHHVLGDEGFLGNSLIQFNYQINYDGSFKDSQIFHFDPKTFYFKNEHLDFVIIAVKEISSDNKSQLNFGWNTLIEEEGKAIISQYINIIQHPNGEHKQLCLRENQIVDLLDDFLHYKTDTAPGSSGSALYNDNWELVGLHHSGVPAKSGNNYLTIDNKIWKPEMGEHRIKWIANEGIRISKVIAYLKKEHMTNIQKGLFDQCFTVSEVSSTNPIENKLSEQNNNTGQNYGVKTSSNNCATWTIPVSISIKVGDDLNPSSPAADNRQANVISSITDQDSQNSDSLKNKNLNQILELAQKEFSKYENVIDIRLGYLYKNGWITKERALVITVMERLTPLKLSEQNIPLLPKIFQGLQIEVVGPTIEDIIALSKNVNAREILTNNQIQTEEIKYFPPDKKEIEIVDEEMSVVLHVSPEEGWRNLEKFIQGTKKELVIGMYDFGAKHVLNEIINLKNKPSFDKLALAIQPGESSGKGTKADDVTDQEVVKELQETFKDKFDFSWVKIGSKNGWVSSSYHIKVAARDENAIWVSSGNLQSSNQPDTNSINGTDSEKLKILLKKYNREWHAIIENKKIASIYKKYLLHDILENQKLAEEEFFELPSIFIPNIFISLDSLESTREFVSFPPFAKKGIFKVQPLLTPDNYFKKVVELIKSAETELLIQNQTFNAPTDETSKLNELISEVLNKQNQGLEVKIIFRSFIPSETRKNLDALVDLGFNTNNIRVQKNCHTKGIIVDRKKLLIGSQNISNAGISVNRDASLLFDDPEAANYFREIFFHDWNNLAVSNIGNENLNIRIGDSNDVTPEGMSRISWKEYMETL